MFLFPTLERRFLVTMFALQQAVTARAARIAFFGLVLTLFGPTVAARASVINYEGSYGSGTNNVALVVDFPNGSGGSDNFAFQVKFDADAIPGFSVLDAVRDGTNHDFDYTIHTAAWGDGVASMTYKTHSVEVTFELGNPETLLYWISNNGGESWSPTNIDEWWGMTALSGATFGNNQVLGWVKDSIVWAMDDFGNYSPTPSFEQWKRPVLPLTETPEPSTLVLLVAGGMAAMAWQWLRRNR
jgi:hypothetical protein